MIYLSWAACYEGAADQAYFDILLPRVMEDLILRHHGSSVTVPTEPAVRLPRGAAYDIAQQACDAKDAFHLVFFHADTGGSGVARSLDLRAGRFCKAMKELCKWRPERCVILSPHHETEAWLLADPDAVTKVLGYTGTPQSIGLPGGAEEAEALTDPKAVLKQAVHQVRGRRRRFEAADRFPAIAQQQSLDQLRRAPSFSAFEISLRAALADLGCIA